MINTSFFYVIHWFLVFFLVGAVFLPLTLNIFKSFNDSGYIFSKIIGSVVLSYIVFLAGILHLLSFSELHTYFILFILFIVNYFFAFRSKNNFLEQIKSNLKIFLFEEILFLLGLLAWSFVRGNMPDINGLEKYMDFGFLNSILRTEYFPPKDMWYTPYPINYYYFGHLVTAVYTKISQLPSYITFNLMLATLFSLTFGSSFSIGLNFFDLKKEKIKALISGLFSSFFVSLAGNLTTIYAFFKAYIPQDKPVPFWNLSFLPFKFPNDYWYPNATRFIPFTIHEFPIYSFVVSDLHGHVLDIPIVLLSIAFMLVLLKRSLIGISESLIFSFLMAVMYMTNAWDGLIYLVLFLFVNIYFFFYQKSKKLAIKKQNFYNVFKNILSVFAGFIVFSLPFSINFKPFVSGIGVLCAPQFLSNLGKIGPFLLEANHCQKSPIWQLVILYGFFYLFIICLIAFLILRKKYKTSHTENFIFLLITISTILIVIPEFVYVKDIYPLHYRANTMFKLVYEAFIMLSLVCGFSVVKLLSEIKNKIILLLFFIMSLSFISLISVYPVFAINSYYRNLQTFRGLDGITYLKDLYPGDYNLINWLNKAIKGQPVVLEANGDSYTNYARISANTGLPTVLGWTVHEWLWRGTYQIVSPRVADVQTLYTSGNPKEVSSLIKKYNISYIVVSTLEKEKYPNLTETLFNKFGKVVFISGQTKLYKINPSLLVK